jgi:hypothetical protein
VLGEYGFTSAPASTIQNKSMNAPLCGGECFAYARHGKGIALRNATQRTPEMAKIVRAEGGVHYTILRMTGARPTGTFASLKKGRSNPWGVTSRWSAMQLGRPLQTNRSDRDRRQ